jgi:hypothetical protein
MHRYYLVRLLVALLLSVGHLIAMSQSNWPQTVTLKNGSLITIYQPQPETYAENRITGRVALSVKDQAAADPIFGAMLFEATISEGNAGSAATLEKLSISSLKLPGLEDDARVQELKIAIEEAAAQSGLRISLDEVKAAIEKSGGQAKEAFRNDPPKIIYANKPSTLVLIDGEPKIQKDEDLDAERVMNTPFLMFKEGNQWNLYAGGLWYKSSSITSGWVANAGLSQKLKSIDEQIRKEEKENNKETATPERTSIVVSTEPAELIQTNGEPNYQTIEGTSLLYVSNTSNDLFKDINTQKTYTLVTGRWFEAPGMNGPWKYVTPEQLPGDFAKIPEGSEKDGVLSNVAGTTAAQEARVDAEIPQTAKVDRSTAKAEVQYDGSPEFERIPGTNLDMAVNSGTSVIRSNGMYYAVDNGIWFESASPDGPWRVSTARPGEVDNIPPSSPVYNVKYVYIYETTPQYVYVGYTPGYMGSYIYGPTVVYGTGWYYRPWYRHYYYPRPCTWGFGFSYNPWTGWSMNFGFNFGWSSFGWNYWNHGHYHGGWFGPPMYRPPYRPHFYGGVYYSRNNYRRDNIYNRKPGLVTRDVVVRPAPRPSRPVTRPSQPVTRPTQPVTRPSRPVTRPTQPVTRPTQPVTRPTRPVTRPEARPEARPSRPVQGNRPVTRPAPSRPAPSRPAPSRPAPKPRPGADRRG